jgi:hypothetical protein
MKAQTIDEVLLELDTIIENTTYEKSHLCIFAWVYRRTTAQIKSEIDQGNFEDNDRMAVFDVDFANYYLDAYHRYQQGESVPESWEVAFDAKNEKLTIIQHVLLGMNAHINLDLAVTAAETMQSKPIAKLENDFKKVNDILAGLLDEMQSKIAKSSFFMFLLDWIGKRADEKIINFSIRQARNQSWRLANELWALEGLDKQLRIEQADRSIGKIGEFIRKPKSGLLRFILKIIGWFEPANMATVIKKMNENLNNQNILKK